MEYYSDLTKRNFYKFVDKKGKIVKEEVVARESKAIAEFFLGQGKNDLTQKKWRESVECFLQKE